MIKVAEVFLRKIKTGVIRRFPHAYYEKNRKMKGGKNMSCKFIYTSK